MIYEYHVNLDERGSFYADVRSPKGDTIYEVHAGNELTENETSLVDDGFMKHLTDVDGVTIYLRDLGIIKPTDRIVLG